MRLYKVLGGVQARYNSGVNFSALLCQAVAIALPGLSSVRAGEPCFAPM